MAVSSLEMQKPRNQAERRASDGNVFEASKPARLTSLSRAAWSFLEFALRSVPCWWGLCLCFAAILTWSARHSMNPDGLSYLDLASEAVTSGPRSLVNSYWSPGYPAVIGVAMFLFHPAPEQEFALIHFVNLLIFVFALAAFSIFLRHWFAAIRAEESGKEAWKHYFTPFAFCTFLWFTLNDIGTEVVTPDLAVAAIVFLAAGLVCRISLAGSGWMHYAALGFVLGVGYYVKAAMLPLGVALLVLLFFLSPLANDTTRRKLAASLSV